MSLRDVLRNQPFHDHDVTPLAVQSAVLFVDTHLTESARPAERTAAGVRWKDPRDQLPVSALPGHVDERGQQLPAQPPTASPPIEIDRELSDAGIAGPRSIGAQAGPSEHGILLRDHEERIPIAFSQ